MSNQTGPKNRLMHSLTYILLEKTQSMTNEEIGKAFIAFLREADSKNWSGYDMVDLPGAGAIIADLTESFTK